MKNTNLPYCPACGSSRLHPQGRAEGYEEYAVMSCLYCHETFYMTRGAFVDWYKQMKASEASPYLAPDPIADKYKIPPKETVGELEKKLRKKQKGLKETMGKEIQKKKTVPSEIWDTQRRRKDSITLDEILDVHLFLSGG